MLPRYAEKSIREGAVLGEAFVVWGGMSVVLHWQLAILAIALFHTLWLVSRSR